jgi:hypothetical protein
MVKLVGEQLPRYGLGHVIYPRLGQGSFRFAVEQAFQQCAVTKAWEVFMKSIMDYSSAQISTNYSTKDM